MRKMILFIWWSSILYVIYLSLKPMVEMPGGIWNIDNIYHALAYAWLMFFSRILWEKKLIPISLALIFMGIAIEIIQPSFGRSCEVGDMLADAVGVVAGAIAGSTIRPKLAIALSWMVES